MTFRCMVTIAAGATALCVGAFTSADVLIAGAPGGGTDVLGDIQSKIAGTGILAGHMIDTYDLSGGTPSAGDLSAYDAILSFSDGSFDNPTLWGDLLADYVDNGGGVLQMTFSWNIDHEGRFFDDGYSPLQIGDQTSGTQMGIGTVYCANHPVMWNVNSFDGGTSSYHNTGAYSPGALPIADWEDGLPFAPAARGSARR